MYEVTLDRPEFGTGFSVICRFCLFTEILYPRNIPQKSDNQPLHQTEQPGLLSGSPKHLHEVFSPSARRSSTFRR